MPLTLPAQLHAALATSTRTSAPAGTWLPLRMPPPSLQAAAGGCGCREGGVSACLLACKGVPRSPFATPTWSCTDPNLPPFPAASSRCYEVRCQPRSKVIDGYGNSFSREECKAGDASVVVRTVDNCECVGAGGLPRKQGSCGKALPARLRKHSRRFWLCVCWPQGQCLSREHHTYPQPPLSTCRPVQLPRQRLQQQALVLRQQ